MLLYLCNPHHHHVCHRLPIIFLLFTILLQSISQANGTLSQPTVHLKSGTIQGFSQRVHDKLVETYLGIPYAEPPLGENRFSLPKPISKHRNSSIFSAHEFGPCCPEAYIGNDLKRAGKLIARSEDCLYLNVWVPKTLSSSGASLATVHTAPGTRIHVTAGGHHGKRKYPVMVYAHGGGLVMLSAGDSKFMDGRVVAAMGDIIVVTFNFRLGALGWLYCDTDEIPGNMGLHDALLAIKWVHENIEHFGGDPNRITINGLSSGAGMMASLFVSGALNLYVSGMMVHSGVASPVYSEPKEMSIKRCAIIAQEVGCHQPGQPLNDPAVVTCLRAVPSLRLLFAQQKLTERERLGTQRPELFLITTGDSYLFPTNMTHLYQQRKWPQNVPVLISLVPDEASVIAHHFDGKAPRVLYKDFVDQVKRIAPTLVPNRETEIDLIANDLVKVYLAGHSSAPLGYLERALRKMMGDWYITCPSLYFADVLAQTNPVWVVEFTYTFSPERKNLPKLVSGNEHGARHGSEIFFHFGVPFYESHAYNDKDRAMSTVSVLNWANFVKQGKAFWTPYQTTSKGRIIPFKRELNVRKVIEKTMVNADRYRCYIWDDWLY